MERFEPAVLSLPECAFILDHLGESPTVALHGGVPHGVNPIEITRHLTEFRTREELRAERGVPWAGFDLIKNSISAYLEWQARTREIQAQGGPRHPSMFTWDSQGNISRGGIGSDSSDMVRSYITDDGERIKFGVTLGLDPTITSDARGLMPWVGVRSETHRMIDTLTHDADKGTITCGICQFTQSYKVKGGRGAYNMARGHMSRHLKRAKDEIARHRVLHRREFQ